LFGWRVGKESASWLTLNPRPISEWVNAGVDQIAHLPGFRGDERTTVPVPSRYEIRAEDARTAAGRRIIVASTAAALVAHAQRAGDPDLAGRVQRLLERNLRTLRDAGVLIAVGSDEYDDISTAEVAYLASTRLFTPNELLRMWAETTPRAIFPERRIGRLLPGYEASFVVLDENPLTHFDNIFRVRSAMKQGHEIPLHR
jgi:imidazolonepropionase-like amidohydrolase